MLTTAYLLTGPSTPETDILPIQVAGARGTDLTSYKTQVYYTPGNGKAMSQKLAEALYRKKS